ncbi:MAG TPA: DUF2911 domain-containing protein [Candidatus Sulfotelmatobacter sp.]
MFAPIVSRGILILFLCSPMLFAQSGSSSASTSTCYLDDGRQIYVRYNPVTSKNDKVVNGKPWAPGGTPMTLFTEAPLTVGTSAIPIGAYTVYPIPSKERWTLAINKNVTAGAAYDEKTDLARVQMETDQVPDAAEALEVAFAHVGPRCTLRIYVGKSASFVDFTAK